LRRKLKLTRSRRWKQGKKGNPDRLQLKKGFIIFLEKPKHQCGGKRVLWRGSRKEGVICKDAWPFGSGVMGRGSEKILERSSMTGMGEDRVGISVYGKGGMISISNLVSGGQIPVTSPPAKGKNKLKKGKRRGGCKN